MNKLIELYCAICHHSEDSRIAEKMQHGSNNKSAQFTDVELMTAYLWGAQQGLLTRKSIYNFIRTYHLGEFQKLPSYQAFCRRLNRLAEAFAALAEVLFEQKLASSEPTHGYVLDSCPVMVSVGSRSNTAKTARNLCNLTRNPTKNLWYHGVKLHVFAQLRPHQLLGGDRGAAGVGIQGVEQGAHPLQSGVCQLADGAQWVSRWHEVIELGDSEQGLLGDIGPRHGNRGLRQIGADIVNHTSQNQTGRGRISTSC